MFDSLKKKFIYMNLIIISVILFVAFFCIYVMNYVSYVDNCIVRLNRLQSLFVGPSRPVLSHSDVSELSNSFIIHVGEVGIESVISYMDYDDEFYEKIIKYADNSSRNLMIDDSRFMYTVINNGPNLKFAFIDVTDNYNSLRTLLLTLFFIYFLMVLVIYVLSKHFSLKYIKPIEENYLKQKRFIADASHELKTPLSIIKVNVDALMCNKNDTIISQEKWINYIINEVNSMDKLVRDLLCLAKSSELKVNVDKFCISEVVEGLVSSLETFIYEKNIKLECNINSDIFINSDVDKFRQVVLIILDNAIKYCEGNICVNVYKGKKVIVEVINDGTIDKDKIDFIFDRFYKCNLARTTNDSYGLGLAIALDLCKVLGFEILVDSEKRTKFSIII